VSFLCMCRQCGPGASARSLHLALSHFCFFLSLSPPLPFSSYWGSSTPKEDNKAAFQTLIDGAPSRFTSIFSLTIAAAYMV